MEDDRKKLRSRLISRYHFLIAAVEIVKLRLPQIAGSVNHIAFVYLSPSGNNR